MENHLHECMYDVLQRPGPSDQTVHALSRLKAKIMRLHSRRLQKILDDNIDADRPDEDQPTIYHILQTKRRRAERTIYSLRDGTGQVHTTPSGIAQTLTNFLRNMYDTIEVNDASVEKLMEVVHCEQPTSYEGLLESPFEPTEIYRDIQVGGRKKARGNDGLGRDSVGSLEIRSLTRWQRYVIPSRMRKAGGSLYACFPLILKRRLIGSPTITCFKHSRHTALETSLSPVSRGYMKVLRPQFK